MSSIGEVGTITTAGWRCGKPSIRNPVRHPETVPSPWLEAPQQTWRHSEGRPCHLGLGTTLAGFDDS